MDKKSERGAALVGTSGWAYREWRGKFYPKGLPQSQELSYLADRVATIEMNSPFYRLQTPGMYEKWRGQVPDGVVFAVKGWRGVTHFKKLRDVGESVAHFFHSGPLALGSALGPVLWQLPPSLEFDGNVLEDFLAGLPQTQGQAAEFSGGHASAPDLPLKYALEPRNESFRSEDAYEILTKHNVALVFSDSAGRHPQFDQVTADFTYTRLHGSPRIYYSNYSEEDLEGWASKLRPELAAGHDCYVYFDNTAAGHAPGNAMELQQILRAAN